MTDIDPTYIDVEQLQCYRNTQRKQGLVFVVEGNPVPKARPRIGRGKAYTPARTAAWEQTIGWKARERMAIEGRELFTMPVRVDMTFCYGNGGADLDNLVKAVLDALNGVVWEDDVQVVSMSARIHRGCPKDQRQVSIGVEALSTN